MQNTMNSTAGPGDAIDIGRVPIRIHGAGPAFARELGEHYAGFFTSSDEQALGLELEPDAVRPDGVSGEACLRVTHDSGRWSFRDGEVSAEWDTGRNRIVVRQTSGAVSIDCLVRMVHTLLLIPEGGFLVHASSVRRNGRAMLF